LAADLPLAGVVLAGIGSSDWLVLAELERIHTSGPIPKFARTRSHSEANFGIKGH